MSESATLTPAGYAELLRDLKRRILAAQLRASLAVNRELVLLYWQIGRDILTRQDRGSWSTKVADRLSADLKSAFPEMRGFSPRNLKYMRRSPRLGRTRQLCNSLLHKFRGVITSAFSTA